MNFNLLVLGLSLLALSSCGAGQGEDPVSEAGSPRPWFVEQGASSGLRFEHVSGHAEAYYMPEIMGGGAALFDMDGDGDLDAYLVQSGQLVPGPAAAQALDAADAAGNQLFENLGQGRFRDVSEGSGADHRGYGNGVACGDVDGDGDVDLFVTCVGPNVLLLNDGAGRFVEASQEAGLGHPGWGTSATFFDAEGDGDLDLFITNYLDWSIQSELNCADPLGRPDYCSPKGYETPAADVFYRNLGGGSFRDESAMSGVGAKRGTGLGVLAADFDGDGRMDVFVANDGMEDHLWIAQEDGSYKDEARRWGCATDINGLKKAGMGVTAADIDGDLDLDLLVCNLAGESDSMYLNQGSYFSDSTHSSGLGVSSRAYTRFGLGWVDFDGDGQLDLFQANGRVARSLDSHQEGDPYGELNLLLRGDGSGAFQEVLPRGGTQEPLALTTRAAAFGDVNGDGAPDVLLVNRDGPAQLLINQAAQGAHWILLDVRDRQGAPALGAQVFLTLGERTLRRDVCAGYSYQASNDPRVHLGLGSSTTQPGIEVRWADGSRQSFGARALDRVHVLQQSN